MQKQEINIVWFKRDLRFTDHEPLYYAQQAGLPVLLLYIFEPSVMAYHDSDVRHWRFIYESLQEMNVKLQSLNTHVHICKNEAEFVFVNLIENYKIKNIYSSQEIGNGLTFERDKEMQKLFSKNRIIWHEFQTNGIIRKLKNRQHWEKRWEATMTSAPKIVDEKAWEFVNLSEEFYQK
jgi:deoxyribodipyrimidine photo-lyase